MTRSTRQAGPDPSSSAASGGAGAGIWLLRSALALTIGAAGWLVVMASTASASASPSLVPTACAGVHMGPSLPTSSAPASYFTLAARPGVTATERLVVANPAGVGCAVTLLAAYGKTAVNAGDTYVAVGSRSPCVGPSCWLRGLPDKVALRPGQRRIVSFTVTVPRHTPSGEYLAGVIGQPAGEPAGRSVGASNGRQGAVGATLVARVAIGVAVIVPGALHPLLAIPAVTPDAAGDSLPSLAVVVADEGNTWEHPTGNVTIFLGGDQRREVTVDSATILPANRAVLSVAVGPVPGGSHEVIVALWYDNHLKVAVWRGVIHFPVTPVIEAGRQRVMIISASKPVLPTWAVALMTTLGTLVLALGAAVLFFVRRRRAAPDAEV